MPSGPEKIRWAKRLRPELLAQLYRSDAAGFRDLELCEEVGSLLLARCETFRRVAAREVVCPACGTVFPVAQRGSSACPGADCDWRTDFRGYQESIRNHYAATGRAIDAYEAFLRGWPGARSYPEKILLIDQLIHAFHFDEKAGRPTKSVASKLFEGNKKDVVRFLDQLSATDPETKAAWRRTVATTIDAPQPRRGRKP
ncbi:MAG: hypothetical protein ABFS41_19000 [Myxococcota bacterium]